MKEIINSIAHGSSLLLDRLHYHFNFLQHKRLDQITSIDTQTQILLSLRYRELVTRGVLRPSFDEVEFRSFSQHGEDGILLYLFSLLGTATKQTVEICAGDGVECNSANLIINHGWSGLLFDGDRRKVEFGRRFYQRNLNTLPYPPQLVNAWMSSENVNALITSHGGEGEIDLLSLDLDGVDYWMWKAITCVQPRVIVLEYNPALGPSRAVTVPYQQDFHWRKTPALAHYWGASLAAFVKLGREKGYRLVGCERFGVNAFFIRSGIAEDILPEVSPEDCFARSRAQQVYEMRPLPEPGQNWVEL